MFMADIYWDQPFAITMKGSVAYYIYPLYFFLIYLDLSAERIERIIKVLFLITLGIFAIDAVTFPTPLFAWRSEERRDGITIFFYGQGFTFLGAFYYLQQYFKTKNILNAVLFGAAFFCLFFLTQSRMNLLALVLGFFLILFYSDFKRKYLIAVLLIIAAASFYFTSKVFNGIKEESNDQAENVKDDIRVLAHSYFLKDLQGGIPTMIFGNGVPGRISNLSLETARANENGFWTADLGLTGIYSYFGAFGALMWILFFWHVFKANLNERTIYLKAYFLMLSTTAFVAYAIFEPGFMPATILVLYLIRCETNKNVEEDTEEEEKEEENQSLLQPLKKLRLR